MVIRNLVSHSGAASPRARRSSPHGAAVIEMMIGTPSLQLAVRGLRIDWRLRTEGRAQHSYCSRRADAPGECACTCCLPPSRSATLA